MTTGTSGTAVDIRHRVGINAPTARVRAALTTVDGLSGWWTTDVRGESAVGEKLGFYFGSDEARAVMEVLEQSPDRVVWRCVDGPQEWIDTEIVFELHAADPGDETVLLFRHAGWREPVEFLAHCSTKWAQFLLTLKDGLEGGRFRPFPEDDKISSWS